MLDTFPGASLRLLLPEGLLTAKDVLEPGEWTHVAAVFSTPRGLCKLHVNGQLTQATLPSASRVVARS